MPILFLKNQFRTERSNLQVPVFNLDTTGTEKGILLQFRDDLGYTPLILTHQAFSAV